MAVPIGRRRVLLLGIVIVVLTSLLLAVRKWQPSRKKLQEEDSEVLLRLLRSSRLLSINLVVIPYLHLSSVPEDTLARRKEEYRTALRRNLEHSLVSDVHVLTTNAQDTWSLFEGMPSRDKLTMSEVNSVAMMRDPFEYISQNLVGKDVMFCHPDIYLGSGFDRVDPVVMQQQKIMYSLTRRVALEDDCDNKTAKCILAYSSLDLCLEQEYLGSHDAFLLHLDEQLPDDVLKELEYNLSNEGMENALMWVFKKKLNYCILNPCSILEIFHLDCSCVPVNKAYTKDKVDYGRQEFSPFTKSLTCSV